MSKKIFHGLCPYTGKPCETFECGTCKVELDERLWLDELDEEDIEPQESEVSNEQR